MSSLVSHTGDTTKTTVASNRPSNLLAISHYVIMQRLIDGIVGDANMQLDMPGVRNPLSTDTAMLTHFLSE